MHMNFPFPVMISFMFLENLHVKFLNFIISKSPNSFYLRPSS